MPFDEALAGRLRRLAPFATEKRMFGGMGLMEDGKMVAGVSHDDLVVRVLPQETELRLREPGAHEMMPGRAMRGWVKVRASALADDRTLRAWVERSRAALRGNGEGKPQKAPLRRVSSRSRRDRARATR